MAFAPAPTECILTFRDRENTLGKTRFYMPDTGALNVDAQAIYTHAQAMAALVAAISDCQLVGMAVVYQDRDDLAVGAGEVERKGVFEFAAAGGTPYITQIPGFLDSLLNADERTIQTSGVGTPTYVAQFIDGLLDGPPGFANGATNAAGLDLVRIIGARKAHVRALKERRGRSG